MSTLLRKTALCLALALGAAAVQAALPADFDAKLAARPEADKARDAARKPKETVALLGLSEGMTVVDVSAGGGWFTRVLSAAVGPQGKVLAQFGERPLQNNNGQAQKDLAAQLGNVEPQFVAMAAMPAGVADAALTALNLHDAFNFRGEEAGVAFVKEIYNVLKPGVLPPSSTTRAMPASTTRTCTASRPPRYAISFRKPASKSCRSPIC